MDYRHKQLEQELAALSKVFSDLGIRLSEVAKEVTSSGVVPSEKLLEQISASRTSFENCRTAIHGHAGAMLVSPLPKMAELVSITAIDSLLKAAAVAEESKLTIVAERQRALEILGRVLAITHRDTTEFKPLQECHARVGELRNAISAVLWPHRHPESESIVTAKHPSNALLSFVENLDGLEDDKWMALETTITASYGKPLFVAASRGKLAVGAEAKADGQATAAKPQVAAPAPPKALVTTLSEASKPIAATEKPVEKKIIEKAPEKPAATSAPVPAVAEKKVTAPPPVAPAAAAPAVAVERKEAAQDRTQQKPAMPQAVTALAPPAPVSAVPAVPVATAERKESVERPQLVAAPVAPAATQIPVAPAPAAPQAAASVVPTPPPAVVSAPPAAPVTTPPGHSAPVAPVHAAAPPRPPAPVPVAAHNAPAPVAATPAPAPPAPPVASNSHATPSAQPQQVAGSLSALATATDTDKRTAAPAPVEAIDRQRREPRLASPAPQAVAKTEEFAADEAEKATAGDSSQRPQRWGFWRGNRT